MNTKVETLRVVGPNTDELAITLIGAVKLVCLVLVLAVILGAPVLLNVVSKGIL
jgi:hypothetical protein